MGLVGTMAALVLGLLVASAKGSYDAPSSELTQISANIVLLDRILAHYGPEAKISANDGQLASRMMRRNTMSATGSPLEVYAAGNLLQGFSAASVPFNENGIAEFVGTIVVEVQFPVQATKSCVVHEGAHQMVMAGAGFVRAGENCINHAQWGVGADPVRCQSKSWPHETIELSRMFQRPHNRRANRDNTPASHPSMTDRQGSGWGNVVWFVKRQKRIQLAIASRRDARGVSDSCELNSLPLHGCQGVPVKSEAG